VVKIKKKGMPKTLIILLGPTGVGKTELSIEIAKYYHTEIISCDSRQIYKEMKIGTAVPDQDLLATIPHHFIQSHSIHQYYNASKFEQEVLEKLEQLFCNHDVILMTGGSMLYIDALCKGIDDLPNVDEQIRNSLINRFETQGIEPLKESLSQLDPVYFQEVDLKNPKRILHALEICLMTGKPYSSFRTNPSKVRNFNIIKIGLNRDREVLYDRINRRVDLMFSDGLVKESQELYPFKDLNALNTVGYRELFDFFEEKITLMEAKEKIKANSRKYARKQLTWFRHDPEIRWFLPEMRDEIIFYIDRELKNKY
jgi:tRNA dimethylallyltransferase